jgi:hypothetical protein
MRRQTFSTWQVMNLLLHASTPTTGGAGAVPGTAGNTIRFRRRMGNKLVHTLPALPCAGKGWPCCTRWRPSLFPLLSSPHSLIVCGNTTMTAFGLTSLWTAMDNGLVIVQYTVTCVLPMTACIWPTNCSVSALRELSSTATVYTFGLRYLLQNTPMRLAITPVNSWGRF